ncbi:MAG: DUF1801 domain-containing protein [Sphaerochaeta sp.]|nr:DUF1801 domain-containing protein [Sphaerochaeta sp.]
MGEKDRRVDAYIAQFPQEQQSRLTALRSLIHETVPAVRETIKYAMPTFLYGGDLIYIAGAKAHTGVYPMPSGVSHFATELFSYHTSKGAIQFPLDRSLPLELIRRIILFRVEENIQQQEKREK